MHPDPAMRHAAVLGLGYVGCVSAACLADLGYRVTGIDRDENKVTDVLSGVAPFYEPGLGPLIAANVAARRLTASTSIDEIADADVVALMAEGRRLVKERFGIELEPEVQALGPMAFPSDWKRT